jgi:Raf kinase inhibitor-like YbhB/YbcL family protein
MRSGPAADIDAHQFARGAVELAIKGEEDAMQITSTAFSDGATIPRRHSCDGEDLSPPLQWSGAPPESRSFALLCDDPDAPAGTWHHWAVFDIPAERSSLPEGVEPQARGFRQAINDFQRVGYGGPCPPRGHGPHRYHFRLLALSVDRLAVGAKASCREVAREARKHAVAETTLVGRYQR